MTAPGQFLLALDRPAAQAPGAAGQTARRQPARRGHTLFLVSARAHYRVPPACSRCNVSHACNGTRCGAKWLINLRRSAWSPWWSLYPTTESTGCDRTSSGY